MVELIRGGKAEDEKIRQSGGKDMIGARGNGGQDSVDETARNSTQVTESWEIGVNQETALELTSAFVNFMHIKN